MKIEIKNKIKLCTKTFLAGLMMSSVLNSAYATQHLKLVLGKYECLSNQDCENGYCDIDIHICKTFANACPEIPDCPECPICPDVPDTPSCQSGQHELDGTCVECVSNADCQNASQPWCDTTSFSCKSCPSIKPFWNGAFCEACPQGTVQLDDSCVCPDDKPYHAATCIACEGNQVFDSNQNLCRCPDNLPNWNTSTSVCVAACESNKVWYETQNSCQCPIETPFWDSDIAQCVPCSGISVNGKCYDCDSSVGETVDEANLLCVIDLKPENFHLLNSTPNSTRTIAKIEEALKYEYTLVAKSTLVDDVLRITYGPSNEPDKQETKVIFEPIIHYTGSGKIATKTLPEGTIATLFIYNSNTGYTGNEMGFIGTIVLQRPISKVLEQQ